jgi:small subunit ribosomal protein S2
MFSHPNMSENTEIIENDTIDSNEAIVDGNESNKLPEPINQSETPSDEAETPSDEAETPSEEKHDNELNLESSESENLEKMILSTGIRVGTPVKTKSMSRYIVRANP